MAHRHPASVTHEPAPNEALQLLGQPARSNVNQRRRCFNRCLLVVVVVVVGTYRIDLGIGTRHCHSLESNGQ
jgi:hypothetical protein